MKKQDFLAISLPYGLQCKNPDIERYVYDFDSDRYSRACELGDINYIPIVRPLSDLTKEIEHGGEKFVPMIELAKVSYSKLKWKCGIETLNGISKCYLYSDSGKKEYQFIFCKSEQSFSLVSCPRNEFKYVPFQLQLLQKLIEWHFDIAGLIERGEAIDVNTLPENPYK